MATFVRVQEIEHPIGPTGRFHLRSTSSDVQLRGIGGDVARVRVEFEVQAASDAEADEAFEGIQFTVNAGEGILEVAEPRQANRGIGAITRMLRIAGVKVEASIIAEVPAHAAVTYDGVSGDLIAMRTLGTQEYKTVSGDIVLSDAGGHIRMNGVSGDVSLRADAAVWLQGNTVSGDLSAIAPRLEECRVVTVSGDVELDGYLSPGAPHRIETVSGDLSLGLSGGLTLEVRGLSTDVHISAAHRSEGSRERRRYIIGDGAASLLFSSMSGDVSVGPARRGGGAIPPPAPPAPPAAPAPPSPPAPAVDPAAELEILRAVERGEIGVEEAARRLAGDRSNG